MSAATMEVFARLQAGLQAIAVAEGGEMFFNKPDRWYEAPHWRCINEHVSTSYLKSEALGADVCLACREPVALTFPEDTDGPLIAPHPPTVVVEVDDVR